MTDHGLNGRKRRLKRIANKTEYKPVGIDWRAKSQRFTYEILHPSLGKLWITVDPQGIDIRKIIKRKGKDVPIIMQLLWPYIFEQIKHEIEVYDERLIENESKKKQ